jgi:hypothetical protein
MSGAFHSHFPPTGYPTGLHPRGGGHFTDPTLSPAAPNSSFDILEWYPLYQSCQKYFVDKAQHEYQIQATAAFINIRLPFQWATNPVVSSAPLPIAPAAGPAAYNLPLPRQGPVMGSRGQGDPAWVSLVPYIRRLIVTGMDTEGIMHGFFGDDWRKGVGPVQECERRNYLFTAKSGGWAHVKAQYDMSAHESVPFLTPLQNVQLAEIQAAERSWSKWLAMEDWMVGPRAPDAEDQGQEGSERVVS